MSDKTPKFFNQGFKPMAGDNETEKIKKSIHLITESMQTLAQAFDDGARMIEEIRHEQARQDNILKGVVWIGSVIMVLFGAALLMVMKR